ncbi:MAG TPA: cyclodeaminase/cyclohydrolase family protein, partial [Gaiellaceae bacterium]|nr:cyclodeaminase/cyclohydrolase family protein [Gaiellaceae bacterium]
MAYSGELLDVSVRQLLEIFASRDAAPAAGSAAAIVVAIAAGLIGKIARASPDWPEAPAIVAQADRLRKRTAPLAQSDADAYLEALAALHLPEHLESEVRDMALGQVLARAAEIPLAIAEAGADVASLAAVAADRGVAERRGEAIGAALLAESATRVAAEL